MAEKEIKITFAGEKLEALSFFLAEQGGKTVEELLKSHLDKSYEKNVPAQVRKFVESRMETLQETANQEQESQRTGGTRQQRASGRRGRDTDIRKDLFRGNGNCGRDSRKYDEHGNVRRISERI